jgi:ADP-heptose:LPS heptosyltransferase
MSDSSPSRILLVRLSHLGDVVLALPVFHALSRRFPRAEIGWAVQPEFASLLTGMPGLARLFLFERRGGLAAWARLREELAAWGPALAVDAQGNVKSAMVALASGAPRRVGMARADWAEPFAATALTEEAPLALGMHGMQGSLALASHIAPDASPRFDPALEPAEIAAAACELDARFPADRPGWILHLSREDDVRSWPAVAFEELGLRLAQTGRHVLFLSGPREEAMGARLAERLAPLPLAPGGIHHWVGQRGLRSLAASFAVAAERGHELVACDSGPAHLAAAVGLSVTLLAGPQDPFRTGPWPLAGRDPRSTHRTILSARRFPCQPCLARVCSHPRGPVCMRELAPEDVARALLQERPIATARRASEACG